METGVIVALIGAVVALVGVWLAHRLTLSRERRAEVQKHAAAFRMPFEKTISDIEMDRVPQLAQHFNLTGMLEREFDRHRLAVEAFGGHLGKKKRGRMQRAWNEYHRHPGTETTSFVQYATLGVSRDTAEKNKTLALQRLKRIAAFGNT